MPFRQAKAVRKLLENHRRTGEPSPVIFSKVWLELNNLSNQGHGKAKGSFTEKLRKSLRDWQQQKGGTWASQLTFDYKLHRHKIIKVTGYYPYIAHLPAYGKGMKGFVLRLSNISIDGIMYKGAGAVYFAWNRIIGREKLLALPSGETVEYTE